MRFQDIDLKEMKLIWAKRLIKEINQESVNYKDYLVDFMLKLQK